MSQVLRYHPRMLLDSQTPLRRRLFGAGAVLLVGLAHGAHDLVEGDPALPAFLPTVSVVLQVVALSVGEVVARRRGWSSSLSLSLAVLVSLVFGALTTALHARPDVLSATLVGFWCMASGLGVFGLWLLLFFYPDRLSDAQTRALVAESEHRKAELSRLRANLHPHFLLNTLNAVAGLVAVEPEQARRLVSALGDLLRDALQDALAMRSLGEEVQWLKRYAEIFEIRHQGAIRFEWALSPESLPCEVPHLLLQPLLENAIEHGALRRPGGGKVTVASRLDAAGVRVVVEDDGPGMREPRRGGLGLRIVSERLALVQSDATLEIDSNDQGTRVTISIPRPGVAA